MMSTVAFRNESSAYAWSYPKPKVLLAKDSLKVEVRITDLSVENFSSALYETPAELGVGLRRQCNNGTRIRVISIFSKMTIMPLNITEDLLETIFNEYSISPDFADVVASFGQVPHLAEGRSNYAMMQVDDTGCGEVSYQARYVELNKRKGPNPWSLRHTGIYHRLRTSKEIDTVLILHPVGDSVFARSIADLQHDGDRRRSVCQDPILLHETLFTCHFGRWRWYIRWLGERFEGENDLAMVTQVAHAEPRMTFDRVQRLSNTKDLLLFARACCAGNHNLLKNLSRLCTTSSTDARLLNAQLSRTSGYIESTDVLTSRVQNLIELVGYTLTLHNQLESEKVQKELRDNQMKSAAVETELRDLTKSLKKLSQDNADESATIKIITFVSAVYLPGSFVATLLGMNVFLFEEDTKKLIISPNFWIFIVVWIPLMLLTGGIYWYIRSRPRRLDEEVAGKE